MKKALFLTSAFHLFSFLLCAAQEPRLDSLFQSWQNENQPDSTRVLAFKDYIWEGFLFSQPDSALTLIQELIAYSIDNEYLIGKAIGGNLLGISQHVKGDLSQAMTYYKESLDIYESLGFTKGIADITNNIGGVYYSQGNLSEALNHWEQCLTLYEELKDLRGKGKALANTGKIYQRQGDVNRALLIYKENLSVYSKIGSQADIAKAHSDIGTIYELKGEYLNAVKSFKRSLKIQEELDNKLRLAGNYQKIGSVYQEQGLFIRALEYFEPVLKIMEEIGNQDGVASSYTSIGITHQKLKEYPEALDYFERSLELNEKIGNNLSIADNLNNIGALYRKQGRFDEALDYYNRSLKIKEVTGDKMALASTLNNIGNIYKDQGELNEALDYYLRAFESSQDVDRNQSSIVLTNIGNVYRKKRNFNDALKYCNRGLAISEEIASITSEREACECLYKTYKAMGFGNKALANLEKIQVLNDSLNYNSTSKKLQQMEFDRHVYRDSVVTAEEKRKVEKAHQEEVLQKNRTRNLFGGVSLITFLLAGGFFSRWRYVKKSNAIIKKERDRSENLLLNILPAEVAQELKLNGKADARDYDMISILFTDFQGFTETSANLSATELVSEINHCFQAFDHIIERYKIEKIKTIGDAYMAAGGLPIPSEGSAKNTVLAALEMQAFITRRKSENDAVGKPAFKMRVGIHTGPVVAGIVGVKKFQYDVWGDTVNTASRIENNGKAGEVNISQATYDLIKEVPEFAFKSRGKIEAKGKGEIEMWFVRFKREVTI